MGKEFKGVADVRRALEIAAVGGHSIALLGPAGCGKTCFRELVPELVAFEERLCPCGCRGDRVRPCDCTVSMVRRHQKRSKFRQALEADIVIGCHAPSPSEFKSEGWTPEMFAADVQKQRAVQEQRAVKQLFLQSEAEHLLIHAVQRLGFTMKHREVAIRVATTIALMDGKSWVEAQHMAEAIQYRKRDI